MRAFKIEKTLELKIIISNLDVNPHDISKALGWTPYNYRKKGEKVFEGAHPAYDTRWQAISWCHSGKIEKSIDRLARALEQKKYVRNIIDKGVKVDIILDLEPDHLYEFAFGQKTLE